MKDILAINAHLKYVEFILHNFDNESDNLTLGELKEKFKTEFKTLHPLSNQNFGIYRLFPLMLIKENYKNQKKELKRDIEKIKVIRDAVAHGNFKMDEKGYCFINEKSELRFTFQQFTDFIYKIENDFYKNNN